jgi:hypothetical protein
MESICVAWSPAWWDLAGIGGTWDDILQSKVLLVNVLKGLFVFRSEARRRVQFRHPPKACPGRSRRCKLVSPSFGFSIVTSLIARFVQLI